MTFPASYFHEPIFARGEDTKNLNCRFVNGAWQSARRPSCAPDRAQVESPDTGTHLQQPMRDGISGAPANHARHPMGAKLLQA